MQEACKAVKDENMSLREAVRKYSVPVETLRRRTAGLVSLGWYEGFMATPVSSALKI